MYQSLISYIYLYAGNHLRPKFILSNMFPFLIYPTLLNKFNYTSLPIINYVQILCYHGNKMENMTSIYNWLMPWIYMYWGRRVIKVKTKKQQSKLINQN